jgi:L-iditol 2-dehydrogenase
VEARETLAADCLLGPNRRLAFAGPGALSLEESAAPSLGRGDDVILEVLACGLCGTDAHALRDPLAAGLSPGRVLGHEIVGRVAAAREGLEAEIGSLQVVLPNLRCGHCRPCRDGRVNLCDHFVHVGFGRDGGLARYVALPSQTLVGVPNGLHPDVAVLAEPLGCVLNARCTPQSGDLAPLIMCGIGKSGSDY